MIRTATFLMLFALPITAFAQIPPGDSYDPAKHVNPVITFVLAKDFKAAKDTDAEKESGATLLGLSKAVGSRDSVDEAPGGTKKVSSAVSPIHFYPVARQTFKLTAGGQLILYSFRTPQVPVPSMSQLMIARNRVAINKRYGNFNPPEEVQIRGKAGQLFEKNGEITVVWEEEGATYCATAAVTPNELFRILKDLL